MDEPLKTKYQKPKKHHTSAQIIYNSFKENKNDFSSTLPLCEGIFSEEVEKRLKKLCHSDGEAALMRLITSIRGGENPAEDRNTKDQEDLLYLYRRWIPGVSVM